jgi:uncharacterized protein YdhG (YjbR/CyaY superfamily)
VAASTKSGFSAEERAAMKERAKELKASANRAEAEKAVLATIAEMPQPDRSIATRIHEIVTEHAPALAAKNWYGQPSWAKDGTVVLFFQSAAKFDTRYATLGFSDAAALDDGDVWATSFAVTALSPALEKQLVALVTKAAG